MNGYYQYIINKAQEINLSEQDINLYWFSQKETQKLYLIILQIPSKQIKEKDYHPWQQSTQDLDYYLPFFCKEKDILLDMCAGSGTIGVSCHKHNCNFIGIEKDKVTFHIMKNRLSNLQIYNDCISIKILLK